MNAVELVHAFAMTSSGPSSGYGGSLPSTTNLAAVASHMGFPGSLDKGGEFPLTDKPQLGFDEMTKKNIWTLRAHFNSCVHKNLLPANDGVLFLFDLP